MKSNVQYMFHTFRSQLNKVIYLLYHKSHNSSHVWLKEHINKVRVSGQCTINTRMLSI